jgi:hypothetical protein
VNVAAVKQNPAVALALDRGVDNPLAALLMAPLVDAARQAKWIAATLDVRPQGLSMITNTDAHTPAPGALTSFAYPSAPGGAMANLQAPRRLGAMSFCRNLRDFYAAKDYLFPERTSGLIFSDAGAADGYGGDDTRFNIRPCIARVGEHLVISSTETLTRDLIDSLKRESGAPASALPARHTVIELDGKQLRSILAANRDTLVRKNMIEKGNTQAQAEGELDFIIATVQAIGGTWPQLQQALRDGSRAAINRLIAPSPAQVAAFNQRHDSMEDAAAGSIEQLLAWWLRRMITTPAPLGEIMTLFWHNRFAVRADRVSSGRVMLGYMRLLRTQAMGQYSPMLTAAMHDPALLMGFDAEANRKAKPNEHFARRLLTHLGPGAGHFTDADVDTIARAMTGWFARRFPLHRARA